MIPMEERQRTSKLSHVQPKNTYKPLELESEYCPKEKHNPEEWANNEPQPEDPGFGVGNKLPGSPLQQ